VFLGFRSHQTPKPVDFVSFDVDRLEFRVFKKPSTFVATMCSKVGAVKAAEDQIVDVTRQVVVAPVGDHDFSTRF